MATVPLEKDAMEGPFPLEDLALEDATGNNVGTVSAEIPVGPKWCEIRQTVFGWTTQKFPFSVKTAHALKIREPHVITVTGKAFYDIGPCPCRSFKPEKHAERLRGVGNSSGDENGSDSMKYWESSLTSSVQRVSPGAIVPLAHKAGAG